MKVDYSTWKTRLLSIENLKLDVRNPRFSYQSSRTLNQTEIIKYLITNHAVYDLAKDIAINGYLINEEPIVCKEGDYYVVLEGNRRIAACKIILDPYKYLSAQKAKELSKYGSINDKISCKVSPTRRDADTLIYNKHTGIPLQKWDKVSQDAFLFNLIQNENLTIEGTSLKLNVTPSEIRKALRRYSIHQYSIKLFAESPYELEQIQEQGFPITTFERFYDDARGAEFLGLRFDRNCNIQKRLPSEEFDKRFKFIVEQILNQSLTSRTFNNEEDKKSYIRDCIESQNKVLFDLDIPLSDSTIDKELPEDNHDSTNLSAANPNEDKKVKKSRKKSGIFNGHDWGSTGIKKMDDLYLSLTEINYRKHNDIVGIALRCYIDMLIYEFLRVQKKIGEVNRVDFEQQEKYNDDKYDKLKLYIKSTYAISDEEIDDSTLRLLTKFNNKGNPQKVPELGNMITYIENHPELLNNDTRLVQALGRFKSAKDFISLQSCNMFVHNQYVTPTASELESMVTTLAPIIDAMYAIVKNEQ